MLKKYFLVVSLLFLPLLFLAGCMQQGAQFGAPGGVSIQGKVAVPDADCVVSSCTNPQVSSGSEPAPEAKVSLMGENGNNLVTYTNQCGEYEVSGAQDSCYILYAKVKENMWVKQGIIPEGSSYNAGEANAYTTAQVIIYEVAKQLYPGQVKCSDIPGFVPTPELVQAVENALRECRDAQQDATVSRLASGIVRNLFGAPGGGVVPGGGTVIITGGGNGGGGTAAEETYRIEGYVWEDKNGNGVRDSDEGRPNVTVYLTGPVNQTTITDSDGKYVFDNLPAGNYTISIDPPEGYTSTPPPSSITLTLSANSSNNNFLLKAIPGSISGSVYLVGTTTGVNGVKVKLTGGGIARVDSTEPDGSFAFTSLTAGEDYTLKIVELPPGYESYTVSPTTRTVSNLPASGATDQVFYLIPPPKPDEPTYVISGYVFKDKAGGTKNVFDSGEGVNGVTVKLNPHLKGSIEWEVTTSGDGYYEFKNLPAGEYSVEIVNPPSGFYVKSPNPSWYNITLGSNVTGKNFQLAKIKPEPTYTISGKVIDKNTGNPVKDVPVKLFDISGNPAALLNTVLSNANGRYKFEDLPAGSYRVKVELPAGYVDSDPRKYEFNSLSSDQDNKNFLLIPEPTPTYFLKGAVTDPDGNPLSGVTVKLWQWNESGWSGSGQDSTNSNGRYKFENLLPGRYLVKVAPLPQAGYPVANPDKYDKTIVDRGFGNLDFVLQCSEDHPCCEEPVINKVILTPSCSCPQGYQPATRNAKNCCSTGNICTECEVKVEVYAENATEYQYKLYEGTILRDSSEWIGENTHTLSVSDICEPTEMTVMVYAKNDCSSEVAEYEKPVTFNGEECESCCEYYLHQSNANWQGGSGDWDVHVKGLIKGNNCGKSLEVIVKIYNENGELVTKASLGIFKPNPNSGGNISFNGTVDTSKKSKPQGWKCKIIVKDPDGICENLESSLDL